MPMEFYSCCIPAAMDTLQRRNDLAAHIQNLSDEALVELEELYPDAQEMDRDDLVERATRYWDLLDDKLDADILTLPGSAPHIISGGMSLGDSPTDSFDVILFLGRVPGVYALLEKWAREDQAAEQETNGVPRSGIAAEGVPLELLDLACFLAETWSKVDEFVSAHCNSDALIDYPVIQGTKNQIALRKIGSQKYNPANIRRAMEFLLSHAEQREKNNG